MFQIFFFIILSFLHSHTMTASLQQEIARKNDFTSPFQTKILPSGLTAAQEEYINSRDFVNYPPPETLSANQIRQRIADLFIKQKRKGDPMRILFMPDGSSKPVSLLAHHSRKIAPQSNPPAGDGASAHAAANAPISIPSNNIADRVAQPKQIAQANNRKPWLNDSGSHPSERHPSPKRDRRLLLNETDDFYAPMDSIQNEKAWLDSYGGKDKVITAEKRDMFEKLKAYQLRYPEKQNSENMRNVHEYIGDTCFRLLQIRFYNAFAYPNRPFYNSLFHELINIANQALDNYRSALKPNNAHNIDLSDNRIIPDNQSESAKDTRIRNKINELNDTIREINELYKQKGENSGNPLHPKSIARDGAAA